MLRCKNVLVSVKKTWKTYILLLTPLLLLPLLIVSTSKESRCAYVVMLMAIYWTTEPIPMTVTALLPIVLFPLLGVASTEEACAPYLQETNMLFIGSLTVAIAVENCNLHRRIALRVLLGVGTDPKWLMLGFMFTTMFLAMWIVNTAAAAMMMPIVDAVVCELFSHRTISSDESLSLVESQKNGHRHNDTLMKPIGPSMKNGTITPNGMDSTSLKSLPRPASPEKTLVHIADDSCEIPLDDREEETLRKILYISIAYSANIGGTSTLTSAGPNLVLKFVIEDLYGTSPPVDYATWLVFCTPGTIISVFLVWSIFQVVFLKCRCSSSQNQGRAAKSAIRKKYKELGPMTFHEAAVLLLFVLLVLLWMFRDPQFARGWATYFGDTKPKDATAALFVVVLLFVLPAKPFGPHPSPPLVTWATVQQKLPWGVVLLRGGGFSMAEATTSSGLSRWLGQQLAQLGVLSIEGIVVIVSVMSSLLTEMASNSATATVLLPVVAQLATSLRVNPLMLLIPTTLACSFAFLLPVGTPANAVVFSHAKLQSTDMLLPGMATKLICISVMLANLNSLGLIVFDLHTFPDWAVEETSPNAIVNVTLTRNSSILNMTLIEPAAVPITTHI